MARCLPGKGGKGGHAVSVCLSVCLSVLCAIINKHSSNTPNILSIYLFSGGNDNIVNVWNGNNTLAHSLTAHTAAVKALAWCPWQPSLLATGGGMGDHHIRFWNANTGACVNAVDAKSQVSALLWNGEHREIVSGHGFSQNQLTVWRYPTMTKAAELTGHTGRVVSMAISPDATTVVSAGADETLRFWKCFASDPAAKAKQTAQAPSRLTQMIR